MDAQAGMSCLVAFRSTTVILSSCIFTDTMRDQLTALLVLHVALIIAIAYYHLMHFYFHGHFVYHWYSNMEERQQAYTSLSLYYSLLRYKLFVLAGDVTTRRQREGDQFISVHA